MAVALGTVHLGGAFACNGAHACMYHCEQSGPGRVSFLQASCFPHLSCTQHGLSDHCFCRAVCACAVAVQCEHTRWKVLEAFMHLDSSYVGVMCLCCQCPALLCKRHSSRPGCLHFILQPVVVCGVVSLCFVRGLNATMPAAWFFWHQRCMAKIWQQDCCLWWMLRGVEGQGYCG